MLKKLSSVSLVNGFNEKIAKVKKDGKYGYVNEQGKEIVACQYDSVDEFVEGMARVKKSGKYGYVNEQGKEVIACQYDGASNFSEGIAGVKKDGKCGYINANGKEIIAFQYDSANNFSEGMAAVKKDGKWGYVDTKGNEVIAFLYNKANKFYEGVAVVYEEGQYRYNFSEGVATSVEKGTDKYWYINTKGEEIIPCIYNWAYDFSEGIAQVHKSDNVTRYINTKGEEIIYVDEDTFPNGTAIVKSYLKYGCVDKNGKEIVPCIYDLMSKFNNELVKINMFEGRDLYCGCIDIISGEKIVPCIYEKIHLFEDGLFIAYRDGEYRIVDLNGNEYVLNLNKNE